METRSVQLAAGTATAPVLKPENAVRNDPRNDVRNDLRNAVRSETGVARKSSGYGMPCANCRLYYPASLEACPACNGKERVSSNIAPATQMPATGASAPDTGMIEQEKLEREREEFLKQFKSQLLEAHADVASTPAVCSLGEHHTQSPESASICKPCYDRVQERVDVFEAALHIDLKEAAQIVYDAVWADPSDPSKTYTNAASALLIELRKRSGVSSLLGPFHPLGN
jgi:hypothetical protein